VSGRLIFTSTTGGQGTTVSLTTVADLAFCKKRQIQKARQKFRETFEDDLKTLVKMCQIEPLL
jgi:hypothetical protein